MPPRCGDWSVGSACAAFGIREDVLAARRKHRLRQVGPPRGGDRNQARVAALGVSAVKCWRCRTTECFAESEEPRVRQVAARLKAAGQRHPRRGACPRRGPTALFAGQVARSWKIVGSADLTGP
jgi:hypothetical protein